MEDLALIKAVNHSGSFGKNFVMFMKKKKLLFTGLGRSVLGKTMPSSCIVFPIRTSRRANNIYTCT